MTGAPASTVAPPAEAEPTLSGAESRVWAGAGPETEGVEDGAESMVGEGAKISRVEEAGAGEPEAEKVETEEEVEVEDAKADDAEAEDAEAEERSVLWLRAVARLTPPGSGASSPSW